MLSVPTPISPTFLLASPDPALLTALEPALIASGAQVEVVLSLEAALDSIAENPALTLALLDTSLQGMDPRMSIDRLLAAVRAEDTTSKLAIVLISDTVTQEWVDRLAEGVIDDLILPKSLTGNSVSGCCCATATMHASWKGCAKGNCCKPGWIV
jgi:CheY-like chemotaxis protein